VWSDYICLGEVADLRSFGDDERKLSGFFLQAVLLENPWRVNIPHQGVRILGAVFTKSVTLDNADIDKVLWLEDCHFKGYLFLSHARAQKLISLDRSTFEKKIHLNGIRIDSSLFMREITARNRIELWSAKIANNLFFSRSNIDAIFMQLAHVREDVVLEDAHVSYLQMSESKIDGSISIKRKHGKPVLNKVRLGSAKIGGRLEINQSSIMTPVDLKFADIGGNLKISGGSLHGVDLTGAKLGGELQLEPGKGGRIPWSDDATLVLHNATARTINIAGGQWPARLDLRGFSYQFLVEGSHLRGDPDRSAAKDVDLYLQWLGRSHPWSPQPYHYLAQLLTANGAREQAREIIFAGKEAERKRAGGWKYIIATLSLWIIGHGYHAARLFYSIIVLLIVGVLVLQLSGEARKYALGTGISFCLDLLLPILKLRAKHYNIDLRAGVRHYFYFHQLMGYVLAFFIVANLSAIGK
jgi:hypothetical protein